MLIITSAILTIQVIKLLFPCIIWNLNLKSRVNLYELKDGVVAVCSYVKNSDCREDEGSKNVGETHMQAVFFLCKQCSVCMQRSISVQWSLSGKINHSPMMWHLFADKSNGCRLWQKGNQLLGDTKRQCRSSRGHIDEQMQSITKSMR